MSTGLGTTFSQHCSGFLTQLDQLESNARRMKGIFGSSLHCLERKIEEIFHRFSQESLSDPHHQVALIREKIALLKTHPMARMKEESPLPKHLKKSVPPTSWMTAQRYHLLLKVLKAHLPVCNLPEELSVSSLKREFTFQEHHLVPLIFQISTLMSPLFHRIAIRQATRYQHLALALETL